MEVVDTAKKQAAPPEESEDRWYAVIGRSLALIAMTKAEIEKKIGPQAKFLNSIGMTRRDIAAVLDTTEDTVRVELAKAMKSGRSRRGQRKEA